MISTAWAQTADIAAGPGGMLGGFLPIAIVMIIFFFLILRPQEKRRKEHQEMTTALRRGDAVVTAGGLHGTVSKIIDDDVVEIEISAGVNVQINRFSVTQLKEKGQPATKSKKTPAKKASAKKPLRTKKNK